MSSSAMEVGGPVSSTTISDDPLYKTVARFNVIYVLESLGLGQPKTGQDLFDSVIYPAKDKLAGIHAEFISVPTKRDLLRQLTRITHAARVGNHLPIVHIEAHGGTDGIELADGSWLPWREVIPALTDINIACKNNLIVVAISCYGWNLTTSLMPSDRAPAFMVIGPPDPMTAAELLGATRRFYDTLVSALDLNEALEAMNDQLPFAQWRIRPGTAEILYCRVFRQYLDQLGSLDALRARENEIVANISRRRSLTVLGSATVRMEVRRDLADHRAAYDRHRDTFLMLDLFPADRERFGLTFDLCMPDETQA